jgi:hypothetical protein
MGIEVYTENGYRTFTEETPGQLTGKEGYLVELVSTGKVQLLTSGLAIGVMHGKLEGSEHVNIRLLGKGGTIAIGARVKGASGGKLTTTTTGDRSIGIIISPTTNGVDGDVCEVLDIVEKV